MTLLHCNLVTPEKTFLSEDASFVVLPLYDGELGVGPRRAPFIGRLGNGELRLTIGETIQSYYVEGGFVEVRDNVVDVLTSRAVPAAALDKVAAQQRLAAALARPRDTAELAAIRDRAVAQARAELRLTRRLAK